MQVESRGGHAGSRSAGTFARSPSGGPTIRCTPDSSTSAPATSSCFNDTG